MSIEKKQKQIPSTTPTAAPTHISQHLQDLIDDANQSIQTVKEKILEIYHTAKKEGFSPFEARILLEEKVVKVSDRYIRLVLPEEVKDQSKVRTKTTTAKKKGESEQQEEEEEDNNDDFAEHVPQIPAPKQEIKDAESTEITKESDSPDPTTDTAAPAISKTAKEEIAELEDQVAKLTKEVISLRIAKVTTFGNKFDFEYDYELPNGEIVPFIVTCFPDKKTGYILH